MSRNPVAFRGNLATAFRAAQNRCSRSAPFSAAQTAVCASPKGPYRRRPRSHHASQGRSADGKKYPQEPNPDDKKRAESAASTQSYSPTVHDALRSLQVPQSAPEFAAHLLDRHPEYGAGQAAAARVWLAKTLPDPAVERRPPAQWVERVAVFFKPGVTITGRCVLVGLALLDVATRRGLVAESFLSVVASERPDEYPSTIERLTSDAKAEPIPRLRGSIFHAETHSFVYKCVIKSKGGFLC